MKPLNRLKNRYTPPGPGEINSAVTLAAILALGNDVGCWKVKHGAELVGYVYDVKPGPVEDVFGFVGPHRHYWTGSGHREQAEE